MRAIRERQPSLLILATVAATIRGFLLPYARHFRDIGWRVDAMSHGAAGDDAIRGAFDTVHELPLSRSLRDVGGLVVAFLTLNRILRAKRYDIVHLHTPIASFLARLVIGLMPSDRRPAVVYTAHGFHFHEGGTRFANLAYRTAERVAGRWTQRLVVMNDEDEAAARRYRIVPSRRLVRMPGIGIDTDRFSPSAVPAERVATARRAQGVDAAAPLFVLVAEFTARKRNADGIKALAAMRNRDAVLVLAGEGPARDAARHWAVALGVDDRVRFAGQVRDVRPLIAGSVGLLLTSNREGLARAVMEALALEVPVVVSSARGNAELVGADAGFVVPIGDTAAFAQRMDWLVEHTAERLEMGRRGRARMVEQYDQRRLLDLHDRLYEAALAERNTAGG